MTRPTKANRAPAPEWAAVSVNYFDDPDTQRIPEALQLAHLKLIMFTVRAQTDGHVDATIARLARVTARQLADLEAAQLVVDGRLRGWDKWQKPRSDWEAAYEAKVHAGKLGACQKWHEVECRCMAGEPPKRKLGTRTTQEVG